VPDNG